jgi:hypothetical protein
MIEAPDQRARGASLLEAAPDWAMLAVSTLLVVGWLAWIAVATYRLILTS